MRVGRRRFSVIVPVYFNEQSLPTLAGRLADFELKLLDRNVDLELIFVNDGSGDNSQRELLLIKDQRPATKVIKHTKNFGAVAASRTGFRFTTGDAFLVLAADLQDPLETALEMVDLWLAGHPMVIAVRKSRKDPLLSRMLSWLYYRLIDRFILNGYPKGGFDLMLAEHDILKSILDATKNVNPNIFAYSLGYKPVIIEYERRARESGSSRWSLTKKLRHFANTITGFSAVPIRTMSAIGMMTAAISFLYGLYMVVASLFGAVPVHGFTTVVVLLSFFSGLILVTLGIIGEYIWRIFEVVNRNIESVVEEALL